MEKNKMDKSIRIWKGRLEITKYKNDYVINDKNVDLIIHVGKLNTGQDAPNWLWLTNSDDTHIGSIWINTDMKKIRAFLEETNEK